MRGYVGTIPVPGLAECAFLGNTTLWVFKNEMLLKIEIDRTFCHVRRQFHDFEITKLRHSSRKWKGYLLGYVGDIPDHCFHSRWAEYICSVR